MSALELIILGAFIFLLEQLVRANETLGRNPYQQIREHFGNSGANMSHARKLAFIARHGISSPYPGNSWRLLVAVVLCLLIGFYFLQ